MGDYKERFSVKHNQFTIRRLPTGNICNIWSALMGTGLNTLGTTTDGRMIWCLSNVPVKKWQNVLMEEVVNREKIVAVWIDVACFFVIWMHCFLFSIVPICYFLNIN